MVDPDLPPSAVSGDAGAAANSGSEITEDLVKLALRRVKDPELNLNIVDLGLVYGIRVEGTQVTVEMSLTSPACPSGPELVRDATTQVQEIPGVTKAEVNIVWSPPWTPERIEPRVRVYLGF
jgi:metal-sulfur cluster biosynthetic enzyme